MLERFLFAGEGGATISASYVSAVFVRPVPELVQDYCIAASTLESLGMDVTPGIDMTGPRHHTYYVPAIVILSQTIDRVAGFHMHFCLLEWLTRPFSVVVRTASYDWLTVEVSKIRLLHSLTSIRGLTVAKGVQRNDNIFTGLLF